MSLDGGGLAGLAIERHRFEASDGEPGNSTVDTLATFTDQRNHAIAHTLMET